MKHSTSDILTTNQILFNTKLVYGEIMKILLILCFIVLSGCKSGVESDIDRMREPVFIAAISEDCAIVLRDSAGDVLVIPSSYHIAPPICESLKAGDEFIPADTKEKPTTSR